MHAAWVAFAKSGNPHHPGLPEWPRWTAAERPTMRFDLTSALVLDPAAAERVLWDGVV